MVDGIWKLVGLVPGGVPHKGSLRTGTGWDSCTGSRVTFKPIGESRPGALRDRLASVHDEWPGRDPTGIGSSALGVSFQFDQRSRLIGSSSREDGPSGGPGVGDRLVGQLRVGSALPSPLIPRRSRRYGGSMRRASVGAPGFGVEVCHLERGESSD